MKTLSLVPSFLAPFCFWVELFLLCTRFQVHSQVIKLLTALKVLWILLLLFKKVVRPVVSIKQVFPILVFKFWILMLYCATQVFLIFFVLVDSNIVIIKIDKRSFLVCRKKMVLFLVVSPFKRLNRTIVKVGWTKICCTAMPCPKVLLQKEVVSSSNMIVFIGFNASFSVFNVKIELI